jgi:hypothetical protein
LLNRTSTTINGNQIARELLEPKQAAKLCSLLVVKETIELNYQGRGPPRSLAKELEHQNPD